MNKVLIGYVNNWTYLQEDIKTRLAGEPKEGSVYRLLYTEGADQDRTYQIYIGKDSNPAKMDTIFLGNTLKGAYYDKWEFDIREVTKDNYLEFDFKPDELPILKKWLDSDNSDLKDLLNKSPQKVEVRNVEEAVEIDNRMQEVMHRVAKSAMDYDKAMERLSRSLNVIVEKDVQLSLVLSDLLGYIASTYKDKYEAAGKANMAKDFLVHSESSDTAIFNALKYLQRYSTKGFAKSGKIVDVQKAIHYLLFELQRSKNQKTNDKQTK